MMVFCLARSISLLVECCHSFRCLPSEFWSFAHDELSFVKKPKTAAMANKILFHEEKRLISKTGGSEIGCCDAHYEANIETLIVSITENFSGP